MILTHTSAQATPTQADEALFAERMGHHDWSVLMILTPQGTASARLLLACGPVRALPLAVEIDWPAWAKVVEEQPGLLGDQMEAWKDEYARNIRFAEEAASASAALADPLAERHRRLFGEGSRAQKPRR